MTFARIGTLWLALMAVSCTHALRPVAWDGPRQVRFVSYNIYKCNHGRDAVKDEIRRLRPDFLFVQELLVADSESFPKELGMRSVFHRHRNFPNEGIAILTNYPLNDVRRLFDEDGRAFAILARTEVDGRRFMVACVHLRAMMKAGEIFSADKTRQRELASLIAAWREAGSPPMIVGGDFNQIPSGANYHAMTCSFSDALKRLHKAEYTCDDVVKVRIDYFLCTPHWTPIDGGTSNSPASDHRAVWLVVGAVAG